MKSFKEFCNEATKIDFKKEFKKFKGIMKNKGANIFIVLNGNVTVGFKTSEDVEKALVSAKKQDCSAHLFGKVIINDNRFNIDLFGDVINELGL